MDGEPSTTPGPPGDPGGDGPPGPPGPKDSILKLSAGYRRFAVAEGPMAFLIDMVPPGTSAREPFNEAVGGKCWRFRSECGGMDLLVGVRHDQRDWYAPEATEEEYRNHLHNWRALNGEKRVATLIPIPDWHL